MKKQVKKAAFRQILENFDKNIPFFWHALFLKNENMASASLRPKSAGAFTLLFTISTQNYYIMHSTLKPKLSHFLFINTTAGADLGTPRGSGF